MTQIKILGISRATQYSPNSEDRDAAIFAAVASRLSRFADVSIISEDLFIAVDLSEFDLVFSMARGRDVLESLSQAEQADGLIVINSATHLLNMSRTQIAQVLHAHNAAIPPIAVVTPKPDVMPQMEYPFWVKRADACAQGKNDVRLVKNEMEYSESINYFLSNHIDCIIEEAHAEGDLVKFYGVEGTPFFHISYPTDANGFSKFGLEVQNGDAKHYTFDESALKGEADKAASLTGITVYGGDAIIKSDGQYCIIDFNDWPSFSPCRKEAAKAISNRIKQICQSIKK